MPLSPELQPPRQRSDTRKSAGELARRALSPALRKLVARTLAAFAPPPTLTVSEWADRERVLSPEASAEPGEWQTSRAEYLRTVMDSICDPSITRIVVAKGSQVGYTEALNNVLGYFIDQDPAPVLVVQPTVEMAEAWSKDRLSPMLRDTPCLVGKVQSPLTRDSGNTLRQKVFSGGRIAIVGANSPAGLASRPVRIVIADEVDRFPISAGAEGDPLGLAAKRQATFWNRKTLLGSTPTLKETSVIWREWQASDMRRFMVRCGDCGHEQALSWANVKWDKLDGKHLPSTAYYTCESCGAVWTDADRHDAVAKGRWVATNPDVAGVAGFHIPGFLSPWLPLADIVAEFLAARRDPALLQVWSNTVLGEPVEPAEEKIEGNSLLRRGENYGPQSIPDAVQLLTAGVDCQGDRLEVQIIGFGAYEESWAVRYEVLPGDPAQGNVWQLLDHVLSESYHTETGRELRVRVTCVDTGGHHQHHVLTYSQQRRRRNVFPIKGLAGPRPIWPHRVSRTKDNSHIWMIGVDTAKDTLYGRLRIPSPGPSYMHFPAGGAFDAEYFAQLSSEVVRTRYQQGRPYRVWVLPPGRRNEALDTAAYALAGRHAMRIPILLPRPEPRSSSSPPLDDDTAPLPEQVDEPETGFDPPGRRNQHASPSAVRREIDPDRLHSAFAEATRPQGGWIYGGVRPRGSWFNRG
jgi:phage terminase large subunit GpA-like protein